jgi:hypothetical protein
MKADEVEIFCAHDVVEFERLAGRSAQVPADRIVPRGRAAQAPSRGRARTAIRFVRRDRRASGT